MAQNVSAEYKDLQFFFLHVSVTAPLREKGLMLQALVLSLQYWRLKGKQDSWSSSMVVVVSPPMHAHWYVLSCFSLKGKKNTLVHSGLRPANPDEE